MYFKIIRKILEMRVPSYAQDNNLSEEQVLLEIRQKIDHTSGEYWSQNPQIDYADPLCRLGYLYRQAAANATVFERALNNSNLLANFHDAGKQDLNVCAVGGGPGTELLGLAKHLLYKKDYLPRKIDFTVSDVVPYWAETWQDLADAVDAEFQASLTGSAAPVVSSNFLPIDALNGDSYKNYAFMFKRADVVVFNYLFSENKNHFEAANEALEYIVGHMNPNCRFVVIDRLEQNSTFKDDVVQLFTGVFQLDIITNEMGGVLDHDEQTSDLGETLTQALGHPRLTFRIGSMNLPTVFWFVVP